ncbi:SDR family NAD(P)-dependent oxidoreductase [Gordonia sp. ABSL1-1]|uniref:SDR family NAD(P)-dependent oxidoreductase n=1 Tax=Gordonia sp. ABSL1-1 TaxID=3053923 RepID=UPI00257415CB|nr:SDR family NAD(P)-dependent oxidoreductase [Gordonia sp. ABSL1-1]MDL9935446.1 SDR family NAD(P)-dependent oxidoreductase [Gordonia sp. ABSL1-1]
MSQNHSPNLAPRRTIVMTGATTGIGRIAVDHVLAARPDDHLVLLAREPRASVLADELRGRRYHVTAIDTDLSRLADVRAAANRIVDGIESGALGPVHAIIANAGAQFTDAHTVTAEGIEATFAVNVAANHVLIRTLAPHLAAPARITITVSDTHFGDLRHNLGMVPGPRWPDDPAALTGVGAFGDSASVRAGRTAYSTSKLAAIHLVHEYARRLPPGVDVIGFNPAFVPGTSLTRHAGSPTRLAMRWVAPLVALTPLANRPATAGRQLADAALGRTPADTGGYVDRGGAAASSPQSYDRDREARLWDVLETVTAGLT